MNEEQKKRENNLIIPSRQVSFIISGITAVICCAFVTGYFIGKKEVVSFVEHSNVAALVHSNAMQGAAKQELAVMGESEEQEDNLAISEHVENKIEVLNEKRFFANLISFATKKHADRFVKKLAKQGIEVYTKERKSSSKNGAISHWYQVVTAPSSDRKELEKLVSFLTKQERLQGVTIVTYT